MYMKSGKACAHLGVHANTLRKWANEGKIRYIRQPGGQRLYDVSSVGGDGGKRRVCYCRVSSRKQKDDLERQIAKMRSLFPDHEIVSDIGSGLNFKRKGFASVLESALRGDVAEIVVAHRDRLCRFGFELVEWIVGQNGGKVVVLGDLESSPQRELVNDLVSVIHAFACRIPELRKYATAVSQDKDLPDCSTAGEATRIPRDGAVHVQQDGKVPSTRWYEGELDGDTEADNNISPGMGG